MTSSSTSSARASSTTSSSTAAPGASAPGVSCGAADALPGVKPPCSWTGCGVSVIALRLRLVYDLCVHDVLLVRGCAVPVGRGSVAGCGGLLLGPLIHGLGHRLEGGLLFGPAPAR